MGNICFYALAFITFIQFTFGAINFSGVNRTFLNMYTGVLESAILTIDENGEPVFPYFEEDLLKNNIASYLEKNISRYTTSYSASLYFYDLEDEFMCTTHQCSGVKVSLKADINYFFHYEKAKLFYVKQNV